MRYKGELKIILIMAVFFLAGFFLGQSLPFTASEGSVGIGRDLSIQAVDKSASFMIDYGEKIALVETEVEIQAAESVFSLTKRLTTDHGLPLVYDDSSDLGVFVKRIGEKTNGEDNHYWQYWVNNKQVQVAADRYQLQSGDVVMWKFTVSNF